MIIFYSLAKHQYLIICEKNNIFIIISIKTMAIRFIELEPIQSINIVYKPLNHVEK